MSPPPPIVDASDDAAGPSSSSEALAPVAEVEKHQSLPLTGTTTNANATVEAAADDTQLPGPSQLNREHSYQLRSRILRPPNAFLLFAREKRPLVAAANPNDDSQRVNVRLGELWRSLDETEKQRYRYQASQAANEHNKKYPDYVYRPLDARVRKDQKCKVKEIIAKFKNGASPAKKSTTKARKRVRMPAQKKQQQGSQTKKKRPAAKKTTRRASTTSVGGSQSAKAGQKKTTAVARAGPSSSFVRPPGILARRETQQPGSSNAMPVRFSHAQRPFNAGMNASTAGLVREGILWTPVVDHQGTLVDWCEDFDADPLFCETPSSDFLGVSPALPVLVPPVPAAGVARAPQVMPQPQFSTPPAPTLPAPYEVPNTLPSGPNLWPQQTVVQAAPDPVDQLTSYHAGQHGTVTDTPYSGTFDALSTISSYYQQPAVGNIGNVVPQTNWVPNDATPAAPLLPPATHLDPNNFDTSASHSLADADVSTGDPDIDEALWAILAPLVQPGVSGSDHGAGTNATSQDFSLLPPLLTSPISEPGPAPTTSGYGARQPEQPQQPQQTGFEPALDPELGDNVLEDYPLASSASPPLGLDELVNYILSADEADLT